MPIQALRTPARWATALAFGALIGCGLVYPVERLGSDVDAPVSTSDGAAQDSAATEAETDADATVRTPCAYDWTNFTTPQTGAAYDVGLADFDQDGRLDLATARNYTNGGLQGGGKIMLGQSGGLFNSWAEWSTPSVSAVDLAIADMNGDGRPDLVVALADLATTTSGAVDVGLVTRTGTFSGGTRLFLPRPTAVDVGDVNGDHIPDVLVISNQSQAGFADQRLVVYLGTGTGAFGPPTEFGKAALGVGDVGALAVADVTQDGFDDVVLSNWGSRSLTLVYGSASGLSEVHHITQVCSSPSGVKIGDFDGDHLADIAVACVQDNGFVTLTASGGGLFRAGPIYALVANPAAIAVADLDGDGLDDVLQSGDGQVGFRRSAGGNGTFGAAHVEARGSLIHQAGIAVGDIDGDGVRDVVVAGWSAPTPVVLRGVCK